MKNCVTIGVESLDQASQALAELIQKPLLKNKKIVWLISGGSSLPVAIGVAKILAKYNLQNFYATLVDDHFGKDNLLKSNWQQLLDLGFLLPGAKAEGILQPGLSVEKTGERFARKLQEKLTWADFAIGQFGLGEGFHTGGILPDSPATKENNELAIGYKMADQQRVTVTPAMITKLDVAFINSLGETKRALVEHFLESKASIMREPTQALKTAKQTYLCSDVLP